jgi:hypothetical protein
MLHVDDSDHYHSHMITVTPCFIIMIIMVRDGGSTALRGWETSVVRVLTSPGKTRSWPTPGRSLTVRRARIVLAALPAALE